MRTLQQIQRGEGCNYTQAKIIQENERVSDSSRSAGSVPTWIKIKLRKAIHYIHTEGDYEKGMDLIAKLAGIEINETGAVQTTVSKLLQQNVTRHPERGGASDRVNALVRGLFCYQFFEFIFYFQ